MTSRSAAVVCSPGSIAVIRSPGSLVVPHEEVLVGDRGTLQLGGDLAVAHDHHAPAQLDEVFVIGRADEEADTLSGFRPDEVVDRLSGADIDAAGRVVDQHEPRADV